MTISNTLEANSISAGGRSTGGFVPPSGRRSRVPHRGGNGFRSSRSPQATRSAEPGAGITGPGSRQRHGRPPPPSRTPQSQTRHCPLRRRQLGVATIILRMIGGSASHGVSVNRLSTEYNRQHCRPETLTRRDHHRQATVADSNPAQLTIRFCSRQELGCRRRLRQRKDRPSQRKEASASNLMCFQPLVRATRLRRS